MYKLQLLCPLNTGERMKNLVFLVFLSFCPWTVNAKVSALFHPYDPALETIAEQFLNAQSTIDIAVYNFDNTLENPIFAALASDTIQRRIENNELSIRLIFEGYASSEANLEKMLSFEKLGVDVRHLGSSRKMHHKFAVIDALSLTPKLITGSANWSVSSQRFYNENILFFEAEPGITKSYQAQFNLLWDISKEIGKSFGYGAHSDVFAYQKDIESFFNTENFNIHGQTLRKNPEGPGFALTRQVVKAIDEAHTKIEIATTRIKLRPIYEALLRAAQRGVTIEIVVTMGEYESRGYRNSKPLPACEDIFLEECSTSHNYSTFLDRDDFIGHENIQVRIKFFNLNREAYLGKQMHSKYLLVDQQTLLTGSFNWSYSAEYGHIENLVKIEARKHPKVIQDFMHDFNYLWQLNRHDYQSTLTSLHSPHSASDSISCEIVPMTLSLEEIDALLNSPIQSQCGSPF